MFGLIIDNLFLMKFDSTWNRFELIDNRLDRVITSLPNSTIITFRFQLRFFDDFCGIFSISLFLVCFQTSQKRSQSLRSQNTKQMLFTLIYAKSNNFVWTFEIQWKTFFSGNFLFVLIEKVVSVDLSEIVSIQFWVRDVMTLQLILFFHEVKFFEVGKIRASLVMTLVIHRWH